mgnify:CR=1 FL=1
MSAYYELKKSAKGNWSFNLKAGNHQVILTSQSYDSRASAKKGIASLQKNGRKEASIDRKKSTKGQPYFTVLAANKQIIGKSEMYTSESSRAKGIASVMRNCDTEKIVEVEA